MNYIITTQDTPVLRLLQEIDDSQSTIQANDSHMLAIRGKCKGYIY